MIIHLFGDYVTQHNTEWVACAQQKFKSMHVLWVFCGLDTNCHLKNQVIHVRGLITQCSNVPRCSHKMGSQELKTHQLINPCINSESNERGGVWSKL